MMSDLERMFWVVTAGVFALILGSFLNVCIFRLPRNCMSIIHPRSRCMKCLSLIRWFDNIPLVSFLLLRGRCRSCGKPVSWRYPLVELMTGLLVAYVAYDLLYFPALNGTASLVVLFTIKTCLIASMMVCTFIDLDFRILPDEITLTGIAASLVIGGFFPFWHDPLPAPQISFLKTIFENEPVRGLSASLVGALVGGGIIYAVGVAGRLMFRRDAMGLGDVKYMAMMGGFLGWEATAFAFVLSCFFGSFFGVIQYWITRDRYIAFGPYLSLGCLIMLLFRDPLFNLWQMYLQRLGPGPSGFSFIPGLSIGL